MNLEVVAAKLTALAGDIETEKGPLEFLGLFLREDSLNLWDLVISSPWLKADERVAFEYVADKLRGELSAEELAGLSRIVILERGGAVLNSFLVRYEGHTGLADMHYVADGGAIIRRAYIILARTDSGRQDPQTAKKPRRTKAASSGRVPAPKRPPRTHPAVS